MAASKQTFHLDSFRWENMIAEQYLGIGAEQPLGNGDMLMTKNGAT